jgi:hypothetical protein
MGRVLNAPRQALDGVRPGLSTGRNLVYDVDVDITTSEPRPPALGRRPGALPWNFVERKLFLICIYTYSHGAQHTALRQGCFFCWVQSWQKWGGGAAASQEYSYIVLFHWAKRTCNATQQLLSRPAARGIFFPPFFLFSSMFPSFAHMQRARSDKRWRKSYLSSARPLPPAGAGSLIPTPDINLAPSRTFGEH